MKMENYIRAIAGSVILITLFLGWLVSPLGCPLFF
jgi:hypothetical protein